MYFFFKATPNNVMLKGRVVGPYEGGHIADGGRHVKYSSQLSGRNNPRKEAEFSGSGGWRGAAGAAAARDAQVLRHTLFCQKCVCITKD